jgi:hypothetical protein
MVAVRVSVEPETVAVTGDDASVSKTLAMALAIEDDVLP